ncbi:MAG: hypothetical protein AAF829_13570 [Pseudomonadota bacterium]
MNDDLRYQNKQGTNRIKVSHLPHHHKRERTGMHRRHRTGSQSIGGAKTGIARDGPDR